MRKQLFILSAVALALSPLTAAQAAVTASANSLVVNATSVKATSSPVGLFGITLGQTTGETLTSVAVHIANSGSSTAAGADFSAVTVYKDNGNGIFESGTDLVAGTQTTVNVGSNSVVTTSTNNAIDGGKFFVALTTGASWSSAASPVDSVAVTLPADGVVTSANSPTVTATTTAVLTADSVGPALTIAAAKGTGPTVAKEAGDSLVFTFGEATNKPSITAANIGTVFTVNNSHSLLDGLASIGGASWNAAGTELTVVLSAGASLPTVALGDSITLAGSLIQDSLGNTATGTQTLTGTFSSDATAPTLSSVLAKNTGGTAAKEAGDTLELTFSEATNKFALTAANIAGVLQLNNSHSFLDGNASIGGVSWNTDGTKLTLTLSAGTSLPTVTVGDILTVSGTSIKDMSGNNATGTASIAGNFGGTVTTPPNDDDDDNDEDNRKQCPAGLKNGRLYKIKGSATVYLVAGCRLKPFRGAAVFRARGHKFQNIVELNALPTGVTISEKPALPAEGTLVKGTNDKTVWFISSDGRRHGFTREEIFKKLGFAFDKVEIIDPTDLATMAVGENVDNESKHPDGSMVQCTNATVVFKVKGGVKHPFTSAEVFNAKGHQFKHILKVDCKNFTYTDGTPVQ